MKLAAVVLSGGSGNRLWPLSRRNRPKQFVPLFGAAGGTLFRRTMDRIGPLSCARIVVVCNDAHRHHVAAALRGPERARCTVIVEPGQRNTAPAATLAALAVGETLGDAVLLITPSDHLIDRPDAFARAVAAATAAAREDRMVLFGVAPTRAESGYGYIHAPGGAGRGGALRVRGFREKPDPETAAGLIAGGDCYWNSGMFVMKASVLLAAMERFEPDIVAACRQAWRDRREEGNHARVDAGSFARCRNVSIDRAVMEHTDDAVVVPTDMGWRDLGSWTALGETVAADGDGNRVRGDAVLADARGNVVHGGGRLVAVVGADGLIIADTPDAVLVAARDRAREIEDLVARLGADGRPEAGGADPAARSWGSCETLHRGPELDVRRLVIAPGRALPPEAHPNPGAHLIAAAGEVRIAGGATTVTLAAGESLAVAAGVHCRIENAADRPACLIAVHCGGAGSAGDGATGDATTGDGAASDGTASDGTAAAARDARGNSASAGRG